MNIKRYLYHSIWLPLFFLFPSLSFSQKPDASIDLSKMRKDNDYIMFYSDMLILKSFASYDINNIGFSIEGDKSLDYKPNSDINLGFGLNYNWVAINFEFKAPLVNRDQETYGDTSTLNFNLNLFIGRKFVIDFYTIRYDGYYLDQYEGFDLGLEEGEKLIREDIITNRLGLKTFYFFNGDKFSYKSSFNQTERQLKSAGSFSLGFFFEYYRITADDSLIPDQKDSMGENKLDSKYLSFGLSGGYGYNFVLRHWYLTLIADVGLGYFTTPETGIALKSDKVGGLLDTYVAIGYNKRAFQCGLYTATSNAFLDRQTEQSEIKIKDQVGTLNLFFVYRFDVGKSKFFNKIDDAIERINIF